MLKANKKVLEELKYEQSQNTYRADKSFTNLTKSKDAAEHEFSELEERQEEAGKAQSERIANVPCAAFATFRHILRIDTPERAIVCRVSAR